MSSALLVTAGSLLRLFMPQVEDVRPEEVREILRTALVEVRSKLPPGPTALDPGTPRAPLMLDSEKRLIDQGRVWAGPRSGINNELARMVGASLRPAVETVPCGDEHAPCSQNGATVHLRVSNPRLAGDAASVHVWVRWFSPGSGRVRTADPATYTAEADIVVRLERRQGTWHVGGELVTRIT